jgi:UDP-N-acetyl-D-glucosamine/UDP-N-acetyl-D-galactosamine dehydrogenase
VYQELLNKEKQIAVIGLGYVGLPIALEFAKHFKVIGFDISSERVALMQQGQDPSRELEPSAFEGKDISFSCNLEDLRQANFFVVAVPTPVDDYKVPDLKALIGASTTIGTVLKKGDYVIYESTVYPGCTEEDCLPILENLSGLELGIDFKLGYSPERINPGDKTRTIDKILKIVSGSDAVACEEIAKVYGQIITAGIYKAPTIKVAEAAKVIENTQRDLNISLMNELSIIFDKMGIDTLEVIKAAGTKWNFLKFYPGLVGGHCIGVDPYYLIHKSHQLGIDPQVINSGRRINDSMPAFIAKRLVQILIQKGKSPQATKVLVMGITFKENVSDIRNSKVADLIKELMQFSVDVHIVDSFASPDEVKHEYGLSIKQSPDSDYDAVIVAVGHDDYKAMTMSDFKAIMGNDPILMDLKSMYENNDDSLTYWRL